MQAHDHPAHLDTESDEGWNDGEIDEEAEAAADADGLADIAAGRTISWEAVQCWLRSWGTPDELPPPQVGD